MRARVRRLLDDAYSAQELIEAATVACRNAATDDPDAVDYRIALAHLEGARAVLPLPEGPGDDEDAPPSGSTRQGSET